MLKRRSNKRWNYDASKKQNQEATYCCKDGKDLFRRLRLPLYKLTAINQMVSFGQPPIQADLLLTTMLIDSHKSNFIGKVNRNTRTDKTKPTIMNKLSTSINSLDRKCLKIVLFFLFLKNFLHNELHWFIMTLWYYLVLHEHSKNFISPDSDEHSWNE